jgi:hypothetical protein
VTHPVFGYRLTFGRMLEVQASMLAAFVTGDIPVTPRLPCGNGDVPGSA